MTRIEMAMILLVALAAVVIRFREKFALVYTIALFTLAYPVWRLIEAFEDRDD